MTFLRYRISDSRHDGCIQVWDAEDIVQLETKEGPVTADLPLEQLPPLLRSTLPAAIQLYGSEKEWWR